MRCGLKAKDGAVSQTVNEQSSWLHLLDLSGHTVDVSVERACSIICLSTTLADRQTVSIKAVPESKCNCVCVSLWQLNQLNKIFID